MRLTNKTLDMVAILVDESPTIVHQDAGPSIAHQDGLLQQLREAVLSGLEGTGGSSSFGSRPPIDAGAADLLDEISDEASQALAAVSKAPTPYGFTEDHVRAFAELATEHTVIELRVRATLAEAKQHKDKPNVYFERRKVRASVLIEEWADRIEDFFNPPSVREIKAPCPACGATTIDRFRDGETIPVNALNFHRDRASGQTTEAKCSACRARWLVSEFVFLGKLIGAAMPDDLEQLALPDHTLEITAGVLTFHCTAPVDGDCRWWPDEDPSDPAVMHEGCLLELWFAERDFASLWSHPAGAAMPADHPRAGFEVVWDDVPLWWFDDIEPDPEPTESRTA